MDWSGIRGVLPGGYLSGTKHIGYLFFLVLYSENDGVWCRTRNGMVAVGAD